MCDEYWERELARRMRLLAAEDEPRWLSRREPVDATEDKEFVAVPEPPVVAEKKPTVRPLSR